MGRAYYAAIFHRGIFPLLTSVFAAGALKTSCHPLRCLRFMPSGKPQAAFGALLQKSLRHLLS